MFVPTMLLRQIYTNASLRNTPAGVTFSLKNRLSDAVVTGIERVAFDGIAVSLDQVTVDGGDAHRSPASIGPATPLEFPLRRIVDLQCAVPPLADGKHTVEVVVRTRPFGEIKLRVEDAISAETQHLTRIPRSRTDDYSADAVHERQAFVERFAGATLDHVRRFSFDAHAAQGNCEHFSGVAQIPLGFAGPLRINGEHAQGDFLVPLATSEGTLVASYNRGIKLLNLAGGVTCT